MSSPLRVGLSLDIDPDANRPVPGRIDAVSPPVSAGAARFDAVGEGLTAAFDILDAAGVTATMFFESRTAQQLADRGIDLRDRCRRHEVASHCQRHEDLLGKVSGLTLTPRQIRDIISASCDAIHQLTGVRPMGFRAPYTRVDDAVLRVLHELGFAYDSSITRRVDGGWDMRPYVAVAGEPGLWELPLPSYLDARGKRMSGYLWALFERRRAVGEYVDAAAAFARDFPGGLFQLALHPWHLFVDENGECFSCACAQRNCDALDELLRSISELERVTVTPLGACIPAV